MRKYFLFALALSILALPLSTRAQKSETSQPEANEHKGTDTEAKFFQLHFVFKELDNSKVINSRSFSTIASTRGQAVRLRTFKTVTVKDQNRIDFGTKIDALNFKIVGNEIFFDTSIELTDVHGPDGTTDSATMLQNIQNQWGSAVKATFGKSIVLFSADDPGSKKSIQVEVTATPI